MADLDLKKWAKAEMARMSAELEAWHRRHPREVSDVAEEARAKVEGRKPNYGPERAYG